MSDIRKNIRDILASNPQTTRELHADHINPTFVEALDLLGCGRDFVRAEGVRLWDEEGTPYWDFLSGYGSLSLGHNHPDVRAALEEVLQSSTGHFLLMSTQPLASALAARIAELAPGDLSMSYFSSSGSEAVDGALKLARAATRRSGFVFAEGGYHGTTLGALSVTGNKKLRAPFLPLIQDSREVPWADVDAVERELRHRDVAAVILEPLQAEGGVRLPGRDYLGEVRRLCTRYGTLLVLDEVQTGIARTGRMFACEHYGVVPDVLILAKGLSGGLMPISSTTTTPDVWKRAYGTLQKYDLHCTTFSGGPLACAAALATLAVIERDRLVAKAAELGEYLGERLRWATDGHALVREVRGLGLLYGVELRGGTGVAGELVGQWLVSGLTERGVVTQVTSLAPAVVRAEPSLLIDREAIDVFASTLRETLADHATGTLSSLAGVGKRLLKNRIGKFFEGRS